MPHLLGHRTDKKKEVGMSWWRSHRGGVYFSLAACLVLTVLMSTSCMLEAALVTLEEANSVRVYKKMADTTVLVTLGERPIQHGSVQSSKLEMLPLIPQMLPFAQF